MVGLAAAMRAQREAGDARLWCTGRLLQIDTVNRRMLVSLDNSPGTWLPYVPGDYTGITTVFVLLSPVSGQLVQGPCYAEAVAPIPPPPTPAPAQDVTVVIAPTWSGTWRADRGAYDRWNTDRYGGRSTLYQGSGFGSGPLTGLATYGDQVVGLGAASISSVVVATPLATGSGAIGLRGTPAGAKPAGAPAPAGSTATGTDTVALPPDMCEALRTGAAKSLASVGAAYRGTYGTSRADGMALTVTYKRPS